MSRTPEDRLRASTMLRILLLPLRLRFWLLLRHYAGLSQTKSLGSESFLLQIGRVSVAPRRLVAGSAIQSYLPEQRADTYRQLVPIQLNPQLILRYERRGEDIQITHVVEAAARGRKGALELPSHYISAQRVFFSYLPSLYPSIRQGLPA